MIPYPSCKVSFGSRTFSDLLKRGSILLLAFVGAPFVKAQVQDEVVSVYSVKLTSYNREKQADGTFKPETYVFAEGGNMGGKSADLSIDKMSFMEIARAIEPSLRSQNYLNSQAKDPSKVDLLIMVYWGTTSGIRTGSTLYQNAFAMMPVGNMVSGPQPLPPKTGPGERSNTENQPEKYGNADSQMDQTLALFAIANQERDREDLRNANLLGYKDEFLKNREFQSTTMSHIHLDTVNEIEEDRYLVIIFAFDFQALLKNKEKKLLWQTRYSIPTRGNAFNKQLAEMTKRASRLFGHNSSGLVRAPMGNGKVEFGELKVLEEEVK